MVELRCAVPSVGMVVSRPCSPWCHQPMGRRSRIDPCMSGWFDVGWLACAMFMVASLLPQLFGWCLGVSAALWSACSSFGSFCCCRRCRFLGCRVQDVCAARYSESLWPRGWGFKVGRFGWLVGCRMVKSRGCGAFVGMLAGGRGAACCRQSVGRRSRFDPCMPGRSCVDWLACGLFIVGSFFCSSLVGTQLCQPPYGRPVRCGVDCVAARAGVAGRCLCRLLGFF